MFQKANISVKRKAIKQLIVYSHICNNIYRKRIQADFDIRQQKM